MTIAAGDTGHIDEHNRVVAQLGGVLTDVSTRLSDESLSATIVTTTAARAVASIFDPFNLSGPVGQKLTIPTHVTPIGGETTHPSVLVFPEGFAGFKYWMAHTPYPAGAIAEEDPNICASNDGVTWVVPAGLTNPIDNSPGGTVYNSDTELVLGPDGKLWLVWRTVNNATNLEAFYLSTSPDGIAWSPKVKIWEGSTAALPKGLSPTLVFEGGSWSMWTIDMSTSPNTMVRARSTTPWLASPADWAAPTVTPIAGVIAGKEPWHVEVRKVNGQYLALLTACDLATSGTGGVLQVLSSADGLSWTGSGRECIPAYSHTYHDRLYRSTFAPEYIDGALVLRTWYAGVYTPDASAVTVWNLFLTDLRSTSTGAQVLEVATGSDVPAGTPGGKIIRRPYAGSPAIVRRNRAINPAPVSLTTGWSENNFAGTGGAWSKTAQTTGGPSAGSPARYVLTITTAPTTTTVWAGYGRNTVDDVPVTPGEVLTFSEWIKPSWAGSVTSLRVVFWTSGGAQVGAEFAGPWKAHAPTAWERRAYTVTVPATAVRASVRVYVQNVIAPLAGTLEVSSLLVELGTALRPYFDGAQSPDASLTPGFAGTVWATESRLTQNATYNQYWDGTTTTPL